AEGGEEVDVGARHPGVEHVPHDDDGQPGEVTAARVAPAGGEVAPDGEGVEQRLGGVLVGAVTGVDHGHVDPPGVGQPVRGAGGAVPDDDGVGAHRLEGLGGVLERLALGHAGTLGGEVDDVGR